MPIEARPLLIDEMSHAVARAAGLSSEQAGRAVAAVLQFMTGRLPSALVGELHEHLGAPATVRDDRAHSGP